MSAKGRGTFTSDDRFTPVPCATALVSTIPLRRGMRILEPSAGDGSFVRALHHVCLAQDIPPRSITLVAVEPNERYLPELRYHFERSRFRGEVIRARFEDLSGRRRFHWTIGNPPFTLAEEHTRRAIQHSEEGVGFLLRLNFLGAEDRIPFWRKHVPTLTVPLSDRPSFSGDGKSDATEYAWYMWHVEWWEKWGYQLPLTWDFEKRPSQMEQDLMAIHERVRGIWRTA